MTEPARSTAPPPVTPTLEERMRVMVGNRADGGMPYWIGKLYGFAALVVITASLLTAFLVYSYFSINSPTPPDLTHYAKIAPGVTKMYAADGTLLGEFAKEWRDVVAFESMPKPLVDAFLAVEDHEYFQHKGIYFKGIARAVWRNVTAGDFAQGGSTITQQVAKQFLGGEKSLSRKGKEAVMARRLEASYSKRAILAVYLNHIYLGAGAWGVAAAAQRYFQKELPQLTLAESALIAGLAKAPTKFSPVTAPKLAIERRNVVLDKMLQYNLATTEDVAKAKLEPISLKLYQKVFPDRMPYYSDHVKNYVKKKYGEDGLAGAGFTIETAAEPTWEAAAYGNADYAAYHEDKGQGWRGPEWRVDGQARELFVQRQNKLYGSGPLVANKRYLALVDKVRSDGAELLLGDHRLTLPLRNMRWAAKWRPENIENGEEIGNANQALKVGDVIWVSREVRTVERFREYQLAGGMTPQWVVSDEDREWDDKNPDVVKLEQPPFPQIAIFTADHRTGYVPTMVGGSDYDRSVFNRTVQACRQPGSTYKPIYYSLGFDKGYGMDTVLKDVPIKIVDPDTGEEWSPTNLGDTFDNAVTLEYALVFSKNIPSVDLFTKLGAKNVEAWARRLGFTTKIFADDALALGASCTRPEELARAFTVFARNGAWWPRPKGQEKNWVYVRRILDRDGNTVEDNSVAEDPYLRGEHRFDRLVALTGVVAPQAIPARPAFLMSKLLATEVQHGFASVLRATKIESAGKTGTSSANMDTTFVGYTSQFTTLVWMGDDKLARGLGRYAAAYRTMVPLWSRYMFEAAHEYPSSSVKIPWSVPPGVNPRDRGDHSQGTRGPQMDLVVRSPPKKTDGDGVDPKPDI
ncbi:MAG: transglycosylase domain-containing protein [Kofleriaceae bacterium]